MRENKERVQWALLENICVLRSVKGKVSGLEVGACLEKANRVGTVSWEIPRPGTLERPSSLVPRRGGPRMGYMKGQCVEYKPTYCAH